MTERTFEADQGLKPLDELREQCERIVTGFGALCLRKILDIYPDENTEYLGERLVLFRYSSVIVPVDLTEGVNALDITSVQRAQQGAFQVHVDPLHDGQRVHMDGRPFLDVDHGYELIIPSPDEAGVLSAFFAEELSSRAFNDFSQFTGYIEGSFVEARELWDPITLLTDDTARRLTDGLSAVTADYVVGEI